MSWQVERGRGPAAEFHARALPEPAVRSVWVFDVDRPALVLGSTQRDDVVDAQAVARSGVDVVRRRSGGGAVLLVPGQSLWLDVVLPRGDPLWDDDVGRATHWLGAAWTTALAVEGSVVNTGAMVCRPWSGLVCFGGIGPGEVTIGPSGPKVVGISQRRTRAAARFQCTVVRRWDPVGTLELLALTAADRAAAAEVLATAAVGVGDSLDDLVERLLHALPA